MSHHPLKLTENKAKIILHYVNLTSAKHNKCLNKYKRQNDTKTESKLLKAAINPNNNHKTMTSQI